jgi:hypothetical protein
MPSDSKTIRKMWALADENRQLKETLQTALQMLNKAIDTSTPQQVAASGWLGAGVAHTIQLIEESLTKRS